VALPVAYASALSNPPCTGGGLFVASLLLPNFAITRNRDFTKQQQGVISADRLPCSGPSIFRHFHSLVRRHIL
jgi:hypothetical protein